MKTVLTFITAILLISFMFIAMPQDASAQAGCCRTVDAHPTEANGQCIPCLGGACFASQPLCVSQNGFFHTGVCQSVSNGAVCVNGATSPGCCLVKRGECADNLTNAECFTDRNGLSLFPGVSCSNVNVCDEPELLEPTISPRNVPTLCEWGLIALAGALGLISFIMVIRRKRALS